MRYVKDRWVVLNWIWLGLWNCLLSSRDKGTPASQHHHEETSTPPASSGPWSLCLTKYCRSFALLLLSISIVSGMKKKKKNGQSIGWWFFHELNSPRDLKWIQVAIGNFPWKQDVPWIVTLCLEWLVRLGAWIGEIRREIVTWHVIYHHHMHFLLSTKRKVKMKWHNATTMWILLSDLNWRIL